jgi:hypothetical protein
MLAGLTRSTSAKTNLGKRCLRCSVSHGFDYEVRNALNRPALTRFATFFEQLRNTFLEDFQKTKKVKNDHPFVGNQSDNSIYLLSCVDSYDGYTIQELRDDFDKAERRIRTREQLISSHANIHCTKTVEYLNYSFHSNSKH